jgi:hypothetical protein
LTFRLVAPGFLSGDKVSINAQLPLGGEGVWLLFRLRRDRFRWRRRWWRRFGRSRVLRLCIRLFL